MIDPEQQKPSADNFGGAARESRWRVALLLASSAALSGIAIVFWNRRSLQQMREQQSALMPPTADGTSRADAAHAEEFV